MKRILGLAAIVCALLLLSSPPLWSGEPDEIVSELEKLAKQGRKADFPDVLIEQIEANPEGLVDKLVLKLGGKDQSEFESSTYVWAIGRTRARKASNDLMQFYAKSRSKPVRGECLRALSRIGGKECGDFLLSRLDETSDWKDRFDIFSFLAEMQYEEALPKMEELLRQDRQDYYWPPIFVFVKMGDRAIPFLMTKISDRNTNVRAHAIRILGQWLVAAEAAKLIKAQYWKENDPTLKITELNALEKTINDLDEYAAFFEEAVSKEKDVKALKFAQESRGYMNRNILTSAAGRKHISAESFDKAYAELFKSMGKKGNYETLAEASSLNDEAKLKALRTRILERNSDEALYDCFKVNMVIVLNRRLGR